MRKFIFIAILILFLAGFLLAETTISEFSNQTEAGQNLNEICNVNNLPRGTIDIVVRSLETTEVNTEFIVDGNYLQCRYKNLLRIGNVVSFPQYYRRE